MYISTNLGNGYWVPTIFSETDHRRWPWQCRGGLFVGPPGTGKTLLAKVPKRGPPISLNKGP